jgi:hypothetical protein
MASIKESRNLFATFVISGLATKLLFVGTSWLTKASVMVGLYCEMLLLLSQARK